jgi:GT2 family glycosyltransferase
MQKNPKLVGLFIRESIKGDGYFGAVRRFERAFYNGTVIDGLRFFKKSAFIKVGGFDEKLYACEDWDLDKRIKKLGPVDFIQEPIYHNDGQVTLKSYLMKKIYYSHNFSEYIHKWGKGDADVKKQFGAKYRYFGVFIENGKWRQLVRHPELTVGMYFLKSLVGVLYLFRRIKVKILYEILHLTP